MKAIAVLFCLVLLTNFSDAQERGDPKLTEIWHPVQKVISPGKMNHFPPSDAIILLLLQKILLTGWALMESRLNGKSLIVL